MIGAASPIAACARKRRKEWERGQRRRATKGEGEGKNEEEGGILVFSHKAKVPKK